MKRIILWLIIIALFIGNMISASASNDNDGFYGVWIASVQERNVAEALVSDLKDKGIDTCFVYSSDWENLASESCFYVTMGKYETQSKAEEQLPLAIEAGYAEAYVGYTGPRISQRLYYFLFGVGEDDLTVQSSQIILHNVRAEDLAGEYIGNITLIVDEDTIFDASCELKYFGHYREGDTPLSWFQHNKEIINNNPNNYLVVGPALLGVFEVSVTGSHIDRFFGSYWWD